MEAFSQLLLNSKTICKHNMPKNIIMTSGQGIFAFLFLIVATIGTVFQFVTLYQHFLTAFPGITLYIILFSFSISAMVSGGTGILWSLLRPSKFQVISAAFFIMAFALFTPIYTAATGGNFPYVIGMFSQVPWMITLPTIPMLDFAGFWMAAGGGLMTMLIGFAIPKKQM